jgi:alginate O-acetyltransferase complex protein AlgJ
MDSQRAIFEWLIVSHFVLLIAVPEINQKFAYIPDIPSTEKRTLAPYPYIPLRQFSDFVEKFDLFYNDHFGFRNRLVAAYTTLNLKVFGISGLPFVVVGRNYWLFYDGSRHIIWAPKGGKQTNGIGFAGWQGKIPYLTGQLATIKNNLQQDLIWLWERNITYVVLPCPDKHSIYSEYLPWRLRSVSGPSRFAQIIDYMKSDTNISLINMEEKLLQFKTKYDSLYTYFKTDSHWNNIGGFFAYSEIMKRLLVSYPELKPYRFEHFIVVRNLKRLGDLSVLTMLKYSHILDHQLVLKQNLSHNTGPKRKKLLVFGDSYFRAIKSYISVHFDDLLWINELRNASFSLIVNKAVIENYKPTVVILESVERLWTNL